MTSFTHVIITAPRESIAEVYLTLCNSIHDSIPAFQNIKFICVADPAGVRIGSGGGTLNSIDYALKYCGNVNESKIAIIHSGGDSRRAPLHSVCGKAWASINSPQNDCLLATPLALIIRELNHICINIPLGSVVVASSDVLLDITRIGNSIEVPINAVSIVVVPESPEVAKNHGVLVKPNSVEIFSDGKVSPYATTIAAKYLQKPSVDEMHSCGAILELDFPEYNTTSSEQYIASSELADHSQSHRPVAMIDTGVVVFSGAAVQSLLALLEDPCISMCTARGLEASSGCASPTALRLELYSDILHCMTLEQGSCTFEVYCERLGVQPPSVPDMSKDVHLLTPQELYDRALHVLHRTLSHIPLYMVSVADGMFAHLGTSAELLQLLSSESSGAEDTHATPFATSSLSASSQSKCLPSGRTNDPSAIVAHASTLDSSIAAKLSVFARKYKLCRHVASLTVSLSADGGYTTGSDTSTGISDEGICMNSVLLGQSDTSVTVLGVNAVVEHSFLSGTFSIGSRSIISHISPSLGHNLRVPAEMMLQQVPISATAIQAILPNHTSAEPVAILLLVGLEDDVKAEYTSPKARICGQQWSVFFQVCGATVEDVWPRGVEERSLWTAKLFTACPQQGSETELAKGGVCLWFQHLQLLGEDGTVSDSSASTTIPTVAELYQAARAWRVLKPWPVALSHDSLPASSFRFSLSDLLALGDARNMFAWKKFLQTLIRTCPPAPTAHTPCSVGPPPRHNGACSEPAIEDIDVDRLETLFVLSADGDTATATATFVPSSSSSSPANASNNSSKNFSHSRYDALEGFDLCDEARALSVLTPSLSTVQSLHWINKGVHRLGSNLAHIYNELYSALSCTSSLLQRAVSGAPVRQGMQLDLTTAAAALLLGTWSARLCLRHRSAHINECKAPLRILIQDIAIRGLCGFVFALGEDETSFFIPYLKCFDSLWRCVSVTQGSAQLSARETSGSSSADSRDGLTSPKMRSSNYSPIVALRYLKDMCGTVLVGGMSSALLSLGSQYSGGDSVEENAAVSSSSSSSCVPAASHPRVLLLCAWLLKESNPVISSNSHVDDSVELADIEAVAAGDAEPLIALEAQLTSILDSPLLEPYTHEGAVIAMTQKGIAVMAAMHAFVIASLAKARRSGLSSLLESVSQRVVAMHVRSSLEGSKSLDLVDSVVSESSEQAAPAPRLTRVCVADGPVRIDLAGGWSDTPPICYEASGAVLNVAIQVDGRKPVSCAARIISRPVIVLRSLRVVRLSVTATAVRDSTTPTSTPTSTSTTTSTFVAGPSFEGDEVELADNSDFADVARVGSPNALLKAVLIVLGAVTEQPLALSLLHRFGGGIEIACVSDLPAGSGMGGSSILAAVVLKAVGYLLGLPTSEEVLVSQVSQVEQVLTTGGGWQDQVGAIYGGFKLGQSRGGLPVRVEVMPAPVPAAFIEAFERRVFLVYTGQQRLAKNTLINALRKCAITPLDMSSHEQRVSPADTGRGAITSEGGRDIDDDSTSIVLSTISALQQEAMAGYQLLHSLHSSHDSDGGSCAGFSVDAHVDSLARIIDSYWQLKKEMAAGSEPPHIARLLARMRPLCEGLSLCGAGAGGFAIAVLKSDRNQLDLESCVRTYERELGGDSSARSANDGEESQLRLESEEALLTVHSLRVDTEGIAVREVEVTACSDISGLLLSSTSCLRSL